MGFTIVQSVDVSDGSGIYLDNCYITIQGQFKIERRKNAYTNSNEYYLSAGSMLYRDKLAYDNQKNPIMVNIFIEKHIIGSETDFYRIVYDTLKLRVKEIFKNHNLTFVDDI